MDYPYANGVIKAIDERVLDKPKLVKYIKGDPQAFIKSLIDGGYGNGYSGNELEKLVANEFSSNKQLLNEITPNKEYTDLFYLSFDALNIKTLYKKKIFNPNGVEILAPGGNIEIEVLKKAILENERSLLDSKIKNLLETLDNKIEGLKDARLISAIIDNSIYDYIFKKIRRSRDETIKDYFITSIDFINILTYVRSKKLNWDSNQFKEMLLEHGRISLKDFHEAYISNRDKMLRIFAPYYEGKLLRILKEYEATSSLLRLQNDLDGLLIYFMRKHQYKSFTMGPIIYYHLRKLSEAKNIRLIYDNPNIDVAELLDY